MNEIKKWRNERKNITNYLNQRGYKISDIEKELIPQYFSGFIYSLAEMDESLNQAEQTARLIKDVNLIGEMLGEARIQKDKVYDNREFFLRIVKLYTRVTGCFNDIFVDYPP